MVSEANPMCRSLSSIQKVASRQSKRRKWRPLLTQMFTILPFREHLTIARHANIPPFVRATTLIRRLGHCKSSFCRPIVQREASFGRSQFHQLGPNFGPDCLLLPLLFSCTKISSTWHFGRRGWDSIRGADRKFWRYLGRVLREAYGSPNGQACCRKQCQWYPHPFLEEWTLRKVWFRRARGKR